MFIGLDGDSVVWSHGERERVDAIILATGYRPSLPYLRELGAVDRHRAPIHVGGISTTHPGLVYVGLDNQRSFASNTLRGVSADADAVIATLAAHVRDAPLSIGLSNSPHATRPAVPARRAQARCSCNASHPARPDCTWMPRGGATEPAGTVPAMDGPGQRCGVY
ncbi:MAG TPA: hypothetical protein VGL78_18070 [Solirubrobacteraceae bacterium]|jgi:hypothetical protein